MSHVNVFTEDFAQSVAAAGLRARQDALAGGHPVVFIDDRGRYVQEMPDGTLFEIRLHSGIPRESHLQILSVISKPAS